MIANLENLLSIGVGVIGFLVIFVMLFSVKSNPYVNIYLIIIFAFISLRLLTKGLIGLNVIKNDINYSLRIINIVTLISIPCFYLYIKTLIKDIALFNAKFLIHFWFPLLNVLFFIFKDSFYHVINYQILNRAQLLSVIIFIFWYTSKVILLVYRFYFNKESIAFKKQHLLIKKWILFITIIVILAAFRLVYAIYFEHQKEGRIIGFRYFMPNNLIWLGTFFYVLLNPEILYGYPKLKKHFNNTTELKKPSEYWSSNLKNIDNKQDQILSTTLKTQLQTYSNKIDNFVVTNRPFGTNKYTIKNLARDLNLPSSHVSYIFKYNCTLSFSEFKNQHRIIYALQLIEEGFLVDKTLEALAIKTGFTSYNTFFVSFKKHTNCSPVDFIKEQKK